MHFDFLDSNLHERWLHLTHPMVRQLAFCVGSPNILRSLPADLPIMHSFQFHDDSVWREHLDRYWPRLRYLDQHPDELISFLQKLKSTRLGLRFEMFIWFWLLDSSYHAYQLIGHSIQKIDGARTLGELDFLLLNTESNEIEHWEVALKYYLAECDYSLPFWYGLNRSDTLSRKLHHFTQKQFQFADAMERTIQRRFCVLKGQLYLPSLSSSLTLPDWVNPSRRIGHWGHRIPSSTPQYYRLQRHEWICPQPTASSQNAKWWTDGLYKAMTDERYYMYRQPSLLTLQGCQ
ncbi:DUF1853 family protein [Acinetobacter pragensis]|uniref:DUF1853 family protein n=1 Tax=Acinetobacter pragensis TaxID=1806892 RepID=UPI00333F4B7F